MRWTTLAAGVAVAAAVLAGCSEEESGMPSPPGQSTGAPQDGSVPGLPNSGAPNVPTPIADTSRWEADPCSVISRAQLSGAGMTPDRFVPDLDTPGGVSCQWGFDGGSFGGTFITKSPDGLSAVYYNNGNTPFEHFQPIAPIEGHPAVEAMSNQTPADGECAISMGLRDDLTYKMHLIADDGTAQAAEPCKWAATIAGLAVQTM
ncbi:MAG: DUF3558 domain-containing protein, partial [Thermocrispum sp.]